MQNRTDLALECLAINGENTVDTDANCIKYGEITVRKTEITEEMSKRINKPKGMYITVDVPYLAEDIDTEDEASEIIAEEIRKLLPQNKNGILVVGLGNRDITPDALGPAAAEKILATRHIDDGFAKKIGLEGLKKVSVLFPGVLGQTGIETGEIINGITDKTKPDAVIVIDALAAKSIERLGSTVQISDTGISPGSGVGNRRKEISRNSLGIPVIAVGIPTVADAETFLGDLSGQMNDNREISKMIVTPREIDTIIKQSALLLGCSINKALQPFIDSEILKNLV